MSKNKKCTFTKRNISLLFTQLCKALSTKFYQSYRSLTNYQKSSNIKKTKLKLMCTLAISLK